MKMPADFMIWVRCFGEREGWFVFSLVFGGDALPKRALSKRPASLSAAIPLPRVPAVGRLNYL